MKVEKMLSEWHFKSPPSQQSLVQCLTCYEVNPVDDWEEGWVETDECNAKAIVCPACGEHHVADGRVFNVYEQGIEWEN